MEKETLRLVMQGGIAIGILVLVVVVVSLLESRDPLLSEGRILGSPDATKSIIMWSDFTCPYCMEFARSQLPDLYRSYIQTGKAHLVFKHFPAGPDSEIRHLAAECANDQNKFWELHEELYILENKEEILNSARRHNLDITIFEDCIDSKKHQDLIYRDMREGMQLGISGTPAFNINGFIVSGLIPYEDFVARIER